jgi:sugar lactone lactonase YvrE
MSRMLTAFVAAAVLAFGGSLVAQTSVQELVFDGNADLLRTPPDTFVGEVGGVAANSKGQIFVYTRTGHPYATLGDNRTFYRGGSRLFQFDQNGKFVRELGQDVYGFNAAYGIRVDPQDNVWTIDIGASQVVKFDADGRVALVLGRKPETINVRPGASPGPAGTVGSGVFGPPPAPPGTGGPAAGGRGGPEGRGTADGRGAAAAPGRGGAPDGRGALPPAPAAGGGRGGPQAAAPGSGTPGSTFNRPTDVGWDKAGNIYIADGLGNTNRIAKFDKNGNFIKHWGSTGDGQGQFNGIEALVVDAQDNVYVADAGNKRIEVFDAEGNFKSTFGNVGTPLAMCITRGGTQYLYVSHVGDPDGMEDAAIYKVALDGKVLGKFGKAGKLPKEFGVANSIDCRSETELLVGEMTNWRVQKVTLKK